MSNPNTSPFKCYLLGYIAARAPSIVGSGSIYSFDDEQLGIIALGAHDAASGDPPEKRHGLEERLRDREPTDEDPGHPLWSPVEEIEAILAILDGLTFGSTSWITGTAVYEKAKSKLPAGVDVDLALRLCNERAVKHNASLETFKVPVSANPLNPAKGGA